jgi:pyruvate, water dikinase
METWVGAPEAARGSQRESVAAHHSAKVRRSRSAAMSVVIDLGALGAGDRGVAGGKAASLGQLLRAGIPVPPGFVVTVTAFERALAELDPAGDMRREIERLAAGDTDSIARVTAQVRDRISAAPLPAGIQGEITAGYRALGSGPAGDDGAPVADTGGDGVAVADTGGDGVAVADTGGDGVAVAVRSSATGEDSAEASFAGLQDTYLWVRGAQGVADHVRRCWASLYNAEAVGYRRRMGLSEQGLAMAVVVQRMVEPRCAGVMFTRSPATGDRSVIAVEGCWGLGSALVSGEVTPDNFVISKVTGEIVRRTVAAKLRLHQAGAGGSGVTAVDVPESLREQPCLRDPEVAALARLGRRVEDLYGAPQDIEWAITDDAGPGQDPNDTGSAQGIVLLQSRPETVWARRDAAPVATPRPRAVDHVFELLGRVNQVAPPAPDNRPRER